MINNILLESIETWGCILGKGMTNQMFGLIQGLSVYCKIDCKVLMGGYVVFRPWGC